jgi:hypothetical protein
LTKITQSGFGTLFRQNDAAIDTFNVEFYLVLLLIVASHQNLRNELKELQVENEKNNQIQILLE